MKRHILFFLSILLVYACQLKLDLSSSIVISDIDNYWEAYDLINETTDTTKQLNLLEEHYLSKGSLGLKLLMDASYNTREKFVEAIIRYPKYYDSVRPNTLKLKQISEDLEIAINKFSVIYSEMEEFSIYFTMGAMSGVPPFNDSIVVVESELSLIDATANLSEYRGSFKEWMTNHIATNPRENIVFETIRQSVHTQQNKKPYKSFNYRVLEQCLWEGVAEFVCTKILNMASPSPEIIYGKENQDVLKLFEEDLLVGHRTHWFWSNYPSTSPIKGLGKYIGFEIANRHYNIASNKKKAIKDLIEIDFNNHEEVHNLVDSTNVFSRPMSVLKKNIKY